MLIAKTTRSCRYGEQYRSNVASSASVTERNCRLVLGQKFDSLHGMGIPAKLNAYSGGNPNGIPG